MALLVVDAEVVPQPVWIALLPSAQHHITAERRVCIRKVRMRQNEVPCGWLYSFCRDGLPAPQPRKNNKLHET